MVDIEEKSQVRVNKKKARNIVSKLLLVAMTLVVFLPLYITFIGSFKTEESIVSNPLLPVGLTLENYKSIFSGVNHNVFSMYTNSIVITGITLILMIVIAPMAGYYLARSASKWTALLSVIFISGIMIPDEVTILPLVSMFSKLNLIGTPFGLILFFLGARCAVSIFLYERFVETIPVELEEAAIVDGADRKTIFWKIIFPLLKPCTATVIIFVGTIVWNDFLMPLYLLGNSDAKTITVGIYSALGEYISYWGIAFAWVVLAAAPIVILFLVFQKSFISGMVSGAVKG